MKKALLAVGLTIAMPVLADINAMQGCQATLQFIDQKLDATSPYPADQVATVKTGLANYDQFIQQTVIDPGLKEYTKGDTAAMAEFQNQIDAYKATLVSAYHQRFPDPGIKSDLILAVNNCAKTSVPSGAGQQELRTTLETMARWTGLIK